MFRPLQLAQFITTLLLDEPDGLRAVVAGALWHLLDWPGGVEGRFNLGERG